MFACAPSSVDSPTALPANAPTVPTMGKRSPDGPPFRGPDAPRATVHGIVVQNTGGQVRFGFGAQDMGLPINTPVPWSKPERPQGWYGAFAILAGSESETGLRVRLDPTAMWATDTLGGRHAVTYTEVIEANGVSGGILIIRMLNRMGPHTMALQIPWVLTNRPETAPVRVEGPWRVELVKQTGMGMSSGHVWVKQPLTIAGVELARHPQDLGIGSGQELILERAGAVVARRSYRVIDPTGEVRLLGEAEARELIARKVQDLATPKPPMTAAPYVVTPGLYHCGASGSEPIPSTQPFKPGPPGAMVPSPTIVPAPYVMCRELTSADSLPWPRPDNVAARIPVRLGGPQ